MATDPTQPTPTTNVAAPAATPGDTTKPVGTAIGTALGGGVTPKGQPLYSGPIQTVAEAYQELLGRQPDAGGLKYYSGRPLQDAIAGIKASSEYANFQSGLHSTPTPTPTNTPTGPQVPGLASLENYAVNPNAGTGYVPNSDPNGTTPGMNEAIQTNTALAGPNAGNYRLPGNMQQSYTAIQNKPGDMIDPATGQATGVNSAAQQTATAGQATASQATATTAGYQNNPGAAQYNASIIGSMTPQAIAAQGQVDPRSLMQNQYTQLMNFPADQVPDWAKGAVTTANQALAAHGLGSSSVAGQAITSALMQAALPLAQNDANVFANMNLTNINNAQQAAIVNTQARVQTMMSDQAAANASKQFNATSTNQTNQFYSSLASQVSQFNAAQLNAISQSNAALNTQTSQFNATQNTATSEFNASQGNAIAQFNAQLKQQQQQFNANNSLIVAQSNVQWQRQINTANTAGINQANNTNAANLLNMKNQALANMWQEFRDNASYAFTAGQNAQNRAATFAITDLNSVNSMAYLQEEYSLQSQLAVGQAIGGFASNLLGAGLKSLGGVNLTGVDGVNPIDTSGLTVQPIDTVNPPPTIPTYNG